MFGTDIKGIEPAILNTGELELVHEDDSVIQDIVLRLKTPFGGLFYDESFGSHLISFIKEDDTDMTRRRIETEIKRCIQTDSRIEPLSCDVKHDGNNCYSVSFKLSGIETIYHLAIQMDSDIDIFKLETS